MYDLGIKIHYTSSKPIRILASVTVTNNNIKEYDFIAEKEGHISLSCDVPVNIPTFIVLSTTDPEIYYNPLFVTSIELDNFYNLKTYAFKGCNQYDEKFLAFIKSNNLFVENQSNNNCLFFTGNLIYTITSPISGLLFGKRHMFI